VAKLPVKKPRKVYLTPDEDHELVELARLETARQREIIEPSPLARELLVPQIRARLAELRQAVA